MKNIRALLVYISILILAINYLLYHIINNYIYKDVLRIIALSMLLFSIIVNRKIRISNALIAIIAYLLFGVLIGSTLSYNLLFIILIIYAISYEDNYPTVNIEAIACETPVITYETGGSPESMKNIGKVIDKKNYNEIKLYANNNDMSINNINVEENSTEIMIMEYVKNYEN